MRTLIFLVMLASIAQAQTQPPPTLTKAQLGAQITAAANDAIAVQLEAEVIRDRLPAKFTRAGQLSCQCWSNVGDRTVVQLFVKQDLEGADAGLKKEEGTVVQIHRTMQEVYNLQGQANVVAAAFGMADNYLQYGLYARDSYRNAKIKFEIARDLYGFVEGSLDYWIGVYEKTLPKTLVEGP